MAGTRDKPEEIMSKPRQVEVLQGQAMSVAEAVHRIGVTQRTCRRRRRLYGGRGREQLKRLKELETETQRLRRAVSDPSLDTLIVTEAARGNPRALRVVGDASARRGGRRASANAARAARRAGIAPPSTEFRAALRTRISSPRTSSR